ncbi:MAG: hypothetical protein JJE17_07370 [Peptostreptococcaceae bacterium]|nr:hypothetical protein [Peptostreptococcaceae bacterium]
MAINNSMQMISSAVKKVQSILNNENTNRVVDESDDLTSLIIGLFGLAIGSIALHK